MSIDVQLSTDNFIHLKWYPALHVVVKICLISHLGWLFSLIFLIFNTWRNYKIPEPCASGFVCLFFFPLSLKLYTWQKYYGSDVVLSSSLLAAASC